jgi:hypothetical protein
MRYTPWADKFILFSTMPIGLGCVMALIYVLLRPAALSRGMLVITGGLLTAVGLLYPLLFPPACGIIVAKAAAALLEHRDRTRQLVYREWAALGAVLAFAVLVTYAEMHYLTRQRDAAASAVLISTFSAAGRKTITFLVVSSHVIAALALVWRHLRKSYHAATLFLVGGALASGLLHTAFHVPYWLNEYKFMFVVIMCLAVFPALASERILKTWRSRPAGAALLAAGLFVLIPYVHWTTQHWGRTRVLRTDLFNVSTFDFQLEDRGPWADVCTAVRRLTPPDAIVLVDNADYYYPLFTARNQYVPAANQGYEGVSLWVDDLIADHRGNGREIVSRRRAELSEFFHATGAERRQQALDRMLRLRRPLAVVIEPRHAPLGGWLKARGLGHPLHEHAGFTVWLIEPQHLTAG